MHLIIIINYISNKGITEIRWNLYRKCYIKTPQNTIANIEKNNQYEGARSYKNAHTDIKRSKIVIYGKAHLKHCVVSFSNMYSHYVLHIPCCYIICI